MKKQKATEKVLLTFTGFQDPYALGLVGEEDQPGPILSLLAARSFDRVLLFSTPRTENNTEDSIQAISKRHPRIKVEVVDLPLDDPTDYVVILRGLRKQIQQLTDSTSDASYFVSVSSGTPQMHACWVLLVSSGEIPGHILNVRPQKFVTKERSVITEVDLTSPEFPTIRAEICHVEPSEGQANDLDSVVQRFGIVGDNPEMRKALGIGATLAPSVAPILILGETGTGKELYARFVHHLSNRPLDRFVPLNCAAIPKDLVESILFGHQKGAFTGAVRDQDGKFDQADDGTLFLDELGELPPATQAKLLRVVEDGIVEPIGAKRAHEVNVRIIGATNQDLAKAIREGRVRQDLYYRLSMGEVRLPPLRKRRSDIPKIALHVLDRINSKLKNPKRLSAEALVRLQNHQWPGNVRELENVIERSARLASKQVLEPDDLIISEPVTYADPLSGLPEPGAGFSLEEYVKSVRKQLILRAVELANGNKSEAARLLGVSAQAIHKFFVSRQE